MKILRADTTGWRNQPGEYAGPLHLCAYLRNQLPEGARSSPAQPYGEGSSAIQNPPQDYISITVSTPIIHFLLPVHDLKLICMYVCMYTCVCVKKFSQWLQFPLHLSGQEAAGEILVPRITRNDGNLTLSDSTFSMTCKYIYIQEHPEMNAFIHTYVFLCA